MMKRPARLRNILGTGTMVCIMILFQRSVTITDSTLITSYMAHAKYTVHMIYPSTCM